MIVRILVRSNMFKDKTEIMWVSVLKVFKYRGYNFFVHRNPYHGEIRVSHFESGYGAPLKGNEPVSVDDAVYIAIKIMNDISDEKFKFVMEERMKHIINDPSELEQITFTT